MPDTILNEDNSTSLDNNLSDRRIARSGVEEVVAENLPTRIEGDFPANDGTERLKTPLDSFASPGIQPPLLSRAQSPVSKAFEDLVSVQLTTMARAAPYVRRATESSGQVKFVVDVIGPPETIGLSDDEMEFVERALADTNKLIERGAFSVDQVGSLTPREGWQQKFDEYYLGESITLVLAGTVAAATSATKLQFQPGKGVTITANFFGVKFTFDKEATAKFQDIVTKGAGAAGVAAAFGLPLAVAAAMLTINLVVSLSKNFGAGGFCLIYPLFFFPLAPPMIFPRIR